MGNKIDYKNTEGNNMIQEVKVCPQGTQLAKFLQGLIQEGWTIKSSDAASGVVVVEKLLTESKKNQLLD